MEGRYEAKAGGINAEGGESSHAGIVEDILEYSSGFLVLSVVLTCLGIACSESLFHCKASTCLASVGTFQC